MEGLHKKNKTKKKLSYKAHVKLEKEIKNQIVQML